MAAFFLLLRAAFGLGALAVALVAIAAFFGFAVPQFDLLNHAQIFIFPATIIGLLFALVALRGRGRVVLGGLALLGFVASASIMVPEMLASVAGRPAPAAGPAITLMTHNFFGVGFDSAKVAAAILGEDADIIVLQEYFGEQATALHPLLVGRYPYFARCRGGKRANLGLYSRFPFEQVEDGACPANAYSTSRTGHILARFTGPGDKSFSVLTSHMDWPMPVERQAGQLAALAELVHGVEGPLVLAGDFNSTPWSYALRNFADATGLTRETHNLLTYPLRLRVGGAWRDAMPFLPLDHVMVRGVTVHEVCSGAQTASDHLPVVVRFSVD